jgi:HSP20 family molecular chaperone IbpA
MPARWHRITTRSVRVVSYAGPATGDLLALSAIGPLVAPTRWRPAADLRETATSVVLTVELAGVREDDLDIELYPDAVVVSGSRTAASGRPDEVYHVLQVRRGPFRLEVPLPVFVDMDRADASLENGMLTITLAKATAAVGSRAGGGRPARR